VPCLASSRELSLASRIPFTDFLCVHCPGERREHILRRLREFHPLATITRLEYDWLAVESSLGNPQSRFLGSTLPVKFAVGERELLGPNVDVSRVDALGVLTVTRPQDLGQLPGDFCFVVLGKGGVATAVRSCSGVPRLFTFHRAGITAVGTRLEWVARLFPKPLELDAQRLACDDHGLGIAPNHSSALTGIAIVPVGHVAHVGRWTTPRFKRYWAPESLPQLQLTADDLAAEVASRVRQTLNYHLDPDHSNAVLFSGGLDSSLLAAFCAASGVPLDGVTILPPCGHSALTRERYYSSSLSALFRQHVIHHLDVDWLLEAAKAHPGALCPIVSSEWQGLRSLDETPRTVVTGWFADECFGHLRLPELFRHTVPPVSALRRACSALDATMMWYRRRRAGRSPFQTDGLNAPELFNPKATRQFAGWLRAVTWMPRPEGHAERLTLYRRLTDIGGAYAEASSQLGARTIAPFASREVVELATQLDPSRFFDGGNAKLPLRRLAEQHLPNSHAMRPDKGDWGLSPRHYPSPQIPAELGPVLDMEYLRAHPTLPLDEVGTLLWVTALERGRVRIEHDRQAIWNR
jgi:asparagine synthetase B (glutamine-hydrolysing)